MSDFETLEQRNIRILSRFSVFDLREQSPGDLAAAEELSNRAASPVLIVEQGIAGLIEFFIVESGSRIYEIRRFETFLFCSCEAFYYSGKACKHVFVTFPAVCRSCKRRAVKSHGSQCSFCEVTQSSYLKAGSNQVPIKVGNIRI